MHWFHHYVIHAHKEPTANSILMRPLHMRACFCFSAKERKLFFLFLEPGHTYLITHLPSRHLFPPSIFDLCIIISKHRDQGVVFAKVLFRTLLCVLMRWAAVYCRPWGVGSSQQCRGRWVAVVWVGATGQGRRQATAEGAGRGG